MRSMFAKTAAAVLCLGVLTSATMAAPADKADRGAMRAEKAFEPVRTALSKVTGLTDEQKTKTDQILSDAAAQSQALAADAKSGEKTEEAKKEHRQKVMDLAKKTQTSILAVLTAEQKPEFQKALREARMSARDGAPKKDGDKKGDKADAAK